MNYDDEKFDLSAFADQMAKEKSVTAVLSKTRAEIERVERLCGHRGAGTARVRREGFPYLQGLNCLYESVLLERPAGLIRLEHRAVIQLLLKKLSAVHQKPDTKPASLQEKETSET